MRVLVEQSYRETAGWLAALGLNETVAVHRLMGGVDTESWFQYPERPAVLIGTQDMLLSRALNRGYGASRFHWPIDFGLLNTDCLWVFDKPQLMANGVATSAQLAGLRADLGTFGGCPSVWMSATLEPTWLDTVDFRGKFPTPPFELADADYADPRLDKRMTAAKALARLDAKSATDMKAVAKSVLAKHEQDTQTLAVVNTVDRAKALYAELAKLRTKAKSPALLLVHSRFRPAEREVLNEQLQAKGDAARDRIIVATQVVEAGVDIRSRTLVTELAPWASVVQRIGRCNRTGDDGPGRVFWVDLDEKLAPGFICSCRALMSARVFWVDLDEKLAPPYEWADLEHCRTRLVEELDGRDVSPKALSVYRSRSGIAVHARPPPAGPARPVRHRSGPVRERHRRQPVRPQRRPGHGRAGVLATRSAE